MVPSGAFPAEIAVACFPTRKRLLVRLAAVIAGGCAAAAAGGVGGAGAVCSARRVLKLWSEPVLVPPWLVAEILKWYSAFAARPVIAADTATGPGPNPGEGVHATVEP